MDLSINIKDNLKLNIRSSAFIKYQDNYFISKRKDKDYYSIPGGRVSFNEDSKETIIRELKEELDWDIKDNELKLVRIVENFYKIKENYIHEYLFIYEIEIDKKYFDKGNFINLENPLMEMKWYKKDDYIKLNIKPNLIKDIILDNSFKHIINRD